MRKSFLTILPISLAAFVLAGCSTDVSEGVIPDASETAEASETAQPSVDRETMETSFIENKYVDLAYGGPWESQKLDIYLPTEGDGPFPVIVAIHGDGFMEVDKAGSDIAPMLEGVNRGYAVVSVNYRLSSESLFPAAISDVKAAIRFVKANADEYNLDSEKIAAWGGSAGGHLAALAGTSGDDESLNEKNTENSSYSSEVQAVVDWYGQIDFLKMDEQFAESGITPEIGERSNGDSPESAYMGRSITDKKEDVKKANPETYITENDPAFLIQHGTDDPNVPVQQSIDFAKDLTSVLGEENVELTVFDGAVHGGEPFTSDENLNDVFEFLDRALK